MHIINRFLKCILLSVLMTEVYGQTLHIQPEDGLVDERLTITVSGLSVGQPAIIRAQMKDSDGRLWQSFAGFYADENGVVDLSKQAPVNGDYTNADPMGLILYMALPLNSRSGARFTHHYTQPLKIRFGLELDNSEVDTVIVIRKFVRAGVKISQLREDGLVGTYFQPAGTGTFPGLIVLGGSEGGLSAELAALLASHGYCTLALAYFGIEDLPELFEEIPLEYFKKAIDWMTRKPNLDKNKLGILGTSKGAEAALILGSLFSEVKTVVAYAPSGVVWSTIYGTDKSCWSYQGTPLSYIGPGVDPTYRPPRGYPLRAVIHYLYRLENTEDIQAVSVPVEHIRGPVLLISGMDDQLFPSFVLSEMIMDRLKIHNHPFEYKHLTYENAGHQIRKYHFPMAGSTAVAGGFLVLGGTIEGNIKAMEDSWPKVLEFLRKVLFESH